MKYIFLLILSFLWGCNIKTSSSNIEIPDTCFNAVGRLTNHLSDIWVKMKMKVDYDKHPEKSRYYTINYEYGGKAIQTYSKNHTYFIVFKVDENSESMIGLKFKYFYIKWAGPTGTYKGLPDSSEIFTNLDKKYIKMIFPEHFGKYNYLKPVDTLSLSYNEYDIFVVKNYPIYKTREQ